MRNIDDNIDFFFEKPNSWIDDRRKFSNLYLLRRDIYTCFGINPTTGEKIDYGVLWPGAMSVLAGIDLLGKYYFGQDDIGKVGPRFKGYFEKYINNIDSEIIYQFRNSLLHSFGLYSYKLDKKTKKRIEYSFGLTAHGNILVSKLNESFYLIDILTLWRAFEKSINLYLNDLKNSSDLKTNFNNVFRYYSITDMS